MRTCFNCDTHWYSSDNSRAWICGNCGTVKGELAAGKPSSGNNKNVVLAIASKLPS